MEKFFVMKRRLKDGFAVPLAMYDNIEAVQRYIEAEVKENTIEPGFEEYIEKRVLDQKNVREL